MIIFFVGQRWFMKITQHSSQANVKITSIFIPTNLKLIKIHKDIKKPTTLIKTNHHRSLTYTPHHLPSPKPTSSSEFN
jgi:hypothetical protein